MGRIPKYDIGLLDAFFTFEFQIIPCAEWPPGILIAVKFPNRDIAIRKIPGFAIKGTGNNPDALIGRIIAHKPDAILAVFCGFLVIFLRQIFPPPWSPTVILRRMPIQDKDLILIWPA
jgi:hypothetical protein